jgi:hypothetical protein
MRKFVITLAAAGSALAFASPAAAQFFPAPQGYAYGYNNYGQTRALAARIDRIERQIDMLDRRNVVRDRSADRLRDEANSIERRLRRAARNGLNPYEMNDVQVRIARLEQRVQFATANRYGYNSYNRYNGYNGYVDRDRDGRDDRWEREHRRDRDHDGDHDDRDDD